MESKTWDFFAMLFNFWEVANSRSVCRVVVIKPKHVIKPSLEGAKLLRMLTTKGIS